MTGGEIQWLMFLGIIIIAVYIYQWMTGPTKEEAEKKWKEISEKAFTPEVSEKGELTTTMSPKKAIQVIVQYFDSKDYGLLGRKPKIEIDTDHNKVIITRFMKHGNTMSNTIYDISANQSTNKETDIEVYIISELIQCETDDVQTHANTSYINSALEELKSELKIVLFKSET